MSEETSEQRPFPDGKERNVDEDAFRKKITRLNEKIIEVDKAVESRTNGFNQRIDRTDNDILGLKNSLKNYKKTFTLCANLANEAIERMEKTRRDLFNLLSDFSEEKLTRLYKILSLLDNDDDE